MHFQYSTKWRRTVVLQPSIDSKGLENPPSILTQRPLHQRSSAVCSTSTTAPRILNSGMTINAACHEFGDYESRSTFAVLQNSFESIAEGPSRLPSGSILEHDCTSALPRLAKGSTFYGRIRAFEKKRSELWIIPKPVTTSFDPPYRPSSLSTICTPLPPPSPSPPKKLQNKFN